MRQNAFDRRLYWALLATQARKDEDRWRGTADETGYAADRADRYAQEAEQYERYSKSENPPRIR